MTIFADYGAWYDRWTRTVNNIGEIFLAPAISGKCTELIKKKMDGTIESAYEFLLFTSTSLF